MQSFTSLKNIKKTFHNIFLAVALIPWWAICYLLKKYEEMQYGKGFGIYGRGFSKDDVLDETDYRRAYSMANDKHQIKKLKRKI